MLFSKKILRKAVKYLKDRKNAEINSQNKEK